MQKLAALLQIAGFLLAPIGAFLVFDTGIALILTGICVFLAGLILEYA